MFKDDGSISIHNDQSNKPLNYMGKGNVFTELVEEDKVTWIFDTRKESLRITMHEIISDTSFGLDLEDAGLERDGTESHLQAWLAENVEVFGKGFTLVSREYPTGAGPVDLLIRDKKGNPIAVEVKRVAMLGAADQAHRYRESLKELEGFENVRSMVAGVDIRPNTIKLATKRDIECFIVPANWRDTANLPEDIEEILELMEE